VNVLPKLALAALVAGGVASLDMQRPATAAVSISIGIGGNYDYYRPCSYYYRYGLPAPHRCYDYLRRYYGSGIYLDGDFIFRDRYTWGRWRDRDDYRHWQHREYRRDQWRDHGWGRHDGDRRDRGRDHH